MSDQDNTNPLIDEFGDEVDIGHLSERFEYAMTLLKEQKTALSPLAHGSTTSLLMDYRHSLNAAFSALRERARENLRLMSIIDTPENDDFIAAISREAEHQRSRWPEEHDKSKSDWDWFWLIGYLSQKAASDNSKRKHHIITTCAALMNWHRAALTSAQETPHD